MNTENKRELPPEFTGTQGCTKIEMHIPILLLSIVSIGMFVLSKLSLWLCILEIITAVMALILSFKHFELNKKSIFLAILAVVVMVLSIVNTGTGIINAIQREYYDYQYNQFQMDQSELPWFFYGDEEIWD